MIDLRQLAARSAVAAVLVLASGMLTAPGALAQEVPPAINYQGRLTDNTPQQNPITGTVWVRFAIYDSGVGGTPLWQEPASGGVPVNVVGGLFTHMLGASVPLPPAVFTGATSVRYLEITLDPGAPTEEILLPRQAITSTPYAGRSGTAARADDAATLGGVAPSQLVQVTDAFANPGFVASLAGSKITGSVASATTASTAAGFTGPLGGDVGGTQGATLVQGLRGVGLAATSPLFGQALLYDGVMWKPGTAQVLMGDQFTAVSSTPSTTAYSNLARIDVTAPGPGKVRLEAFGYTIHTQSNCGIRIGFSTSPTGVPLTSVFAKSSATLKMAGYPSITAWGGTGDGTATTFPWTRGYEITPTVDIVVYGVYSNRGSAVRVWRISDQRQMLFQPASPTPGTWEINYMSTPVALQGGTPYVVTIDIADSDGFDFDLTPFGGSMGPYLTAGNGRYASATATFPSTVSSVYRYGGVGVLYYRIEGTDNIPMAVSDVMTIASAGTYTYYLNGTATENQTVGGSCAFSTGGMNYIFAPDLGP